MQVSPAIHAQRLDTKLNIQFDWWKLLQSPQLNTLIEQSLNSYPDVDTAQAALLKTQQNGISRTGFFHAAAGISNAANMHDKPALAASPSNSADTKFIGVAYFALHTQQSASGYLPELLHSRELAAGPDQVEVELRRLQLEATYLTLASNLIACVLQESSLRAQMVAARKIAAIDQSLLVIARKQLKAGLVTQARVSVQQNTAERSAQALLALKEQFEQTRELLRLLLGLAPDADLPETFELDALHFPELLSLELPDTLIGQRPDVRAALLATQDSSAKYQSAVGFALSNVEDISLAIYNDAVALKAALAGEHDSAEALSSMRQQYSAHAANYLDMLAAEQNAQLAALRLAQARSRQLGNAVALYHALGGAWWNDTVTLEIAGELSQHRPVR